MTVGIIDVDLLDKSRKHRFPNLACMKLSAYHKSLGEETELVTDWNDAYYYDYVVASKVFSDTNHHEILDELFDEGLADIGGTGFFGSSAIGLDDQIEHMMPDYSLYDRADIRKADRNFYDNYSIGYLTRGCFRKCGFCVNRKYDKAFAASPLKEFHDPSRPKLCFIDDNFLAYSGWKKVLSEVIDTGKPYRFMQGLDERLLTDESCRMLFGSNYDGTPHFAFDKWTDKDIVVRKAELIRKHTDKIPMFYVLCAYDESGKYDMDFWKRDLYETFSRIEVLRKYKFLPYIMRFEKYKESPFRGIYVQLARWCNQPSFFKKISFSEFIEKTKKAEKAPAAYFEHLISVNDFLPERFFIDRW